MATETKKQAAPACPTFSSQEIKLPQLGQGGFAVVRHANIQIGGQARDVAIKSFKLEQDLVQERDVTMQLQRFPAVLNNSVKLLGQIASEKQLLYELMPGGSLAKYLPNLHNADNRMKLRMMRDAVCCVHAVHNAGYLHCDLKPDNFLLTTANPVWNQQSTTLKLCDFGLACKADAESRGDRSDPVYLAPEVKAGGQFTVSADVYSLSIVLFEIWTGHRPSREIILASATQSLLSSL